MKDRTRNVAVGLTTLVAFAMFAVMTMMFAVLPELLQTGRVLKLTFSNTAGAKSGEWIYMSGIQIGKITSIDFAGDDLGDGVLFICRIDSDIKIPGNVEPTLSSQPFMGGPYLSLQATGPDRYDPVTKDKLEYLPEDWPEPLQGRRIPASMLPKELTDGLKSLAELADSLNSLVAAPADTQPADTQPGAQPAPTTLRGTLAKLQVALDDIHEVLGDKSNQANFRKTMAGLANASAKAADAMDALKKFAVEGRKEAGKTLTAASQAVDKIGTLATNTDRRLEAISKEIVTDAEKLSKVLETVNRIATKMDTGEGTVARLVNDPKLYDNFLQTSKQLALLSAELRVLVREWKENGVQLKLK